MDGFKVKAIPITIGKSKAITSVVRGKNDKIYVGMTGWGNVLAEVDPDTCKVTDCGEIFSRKNKEKLGDKIHNGLCVASDGIIWIGEGSGYGFKGEPSEFKAYNYPGGAVFSFNPKTRKLKKHKVPVPMNTIHSMTLSPDERFLCGYTIPDNHFWMYDIEKDEAADLGLISDYCSHTVGIDGKGIAYSGWRAHQGATFTDATGGTHNLGAGVYLYRVDLKKRDAERTKVRVVYGNEYDIAGNTGIDNWCRTRSGWLFGSTTVGGVIFEVVDNGKDVKLVGKPVLTPRVTGMIEGPDGTIWGTAGYPVMNLFSFKPDDPSSMRDYGPVVTEHPMCYFHGITIMDDGTIFTGETDSERPILYKLTPK